MNTMKLIIWTKGDDRVKLVENLDELRFQTEHGGPLAPKQLEILVALPEKNECIEALSARVNGEHLHWIPLNYRAEIPLLPLELVRQITAYWYEETTR